MRTKDDILHQMKIVIDAWNKEFPFTPPSEFSSAIKKMLDEKIKKFIHSRLDHLPSEDLSLLMSMISEVTNPPIIKPEPVEAPKPQTPTYDRREEPSQPKRQGHGGGRPSRG